MLHEILLSLSGHPSPLLRPSTLEADALAAITPPERQLLASAAHLSHVHVRLIANASQISASHPSPVCRAVSNAIQSHHLAAFQRKILDVEQSILRHDPDLVGAYHIVPLTAVMSEFQQWTRKMDWLLATSNFILDKRGGNAPCQGADLICRLRVDVGSGYRDVADAALDLTKVAETAWLKQAAAWVLYGRLPTLGSTDFFIQEAHSPQEEFTIVPEYLPPFVTLPTASSMLYIGKSLNRIRAVGGASSTLGGLDHVSSKLRELAGLTFPVNAVALSRTVSSIRRSLAENTLSKLLPLVKVVDMLQLLRDFFLLGRGEFALALTQEADEKIRNRWRRAGNLANEKDVLKNVTIKDGEVAAVLNRTWTVLASMQGQHADEDEQLDLARDLLRLQLANKPQSAPAATSDFSSDVAKCLGQLQFNNLLFSVPATLHIDLPAPLDMVISPSDLFIYSSINAYLLSLQRAHIRLTDLWKMTSLRRHHAAPRGGGEHAVMLRQRWSARSSALRSSWTTASAAIFFIGETEAYLQTEVIAGLWETFSAWLIGDNVRQNNNDVLDSEAREQSPVDGGPSNQFEDLFIPEHHFNSRPPAAAQPRSPVHDPQSLSKAHSLYLDILVRRLLLTQPTFTTSLYTLLVHIDHLILHMRRLHSIFISMDLEADAGVVDEFVDLEREEQEVMALLHAVEAEVRGGIEAVVGTLRSLASNIDFLAEWEAEGRIVGDDDLDEEDRYTPGRIGGIDRLLMKLDFGSWLGSGDGGWEQETE
ncbi:hypothetical protein HIM_07560 [Hirsutella minnesotensis 3608]|uniref:Spindle pole body component n=1 Tax=Hirsutella minnesotensis 3608 TaxID=1043627 RepID=A0A0F7ZTE8_9HYPO|nr:hypothetical protein HIM_07560 [Hirsutella minnesotensis 3608]